MYQRNWSLFIYQVSYKLSLQGGHDYTTLTIQGKHGIVYADIHLAPVKKRNPSREALLLVEDYDVDGGEDDGVDGGYSTLHALSDGGRSRSGRSRSCSGSESEAEVSCTGRGRGHSSMPSYCGRVIPM